MIPDRIDVTASDLLLINFSFDLHSMPTRFHVTHAVPHIEMGSVLSRKIYFIRRLFPIRTRQEQRLN